MFDAHLTVPVSWRGVLAAGHILDVGFRVEKPILLYTGEALSETIDKLPLVLNDLVRAHGDAEQKRLYRYNGTGGMEPGFVNYCDNQMKEVAKHDGVAVAMLHDMFCPELAANLSEVIVANATHVEDHRGRKVVTTTWYIQKGSKGGDIPDAYAQSGF